MSEDKAKRMVYCDGVSDGAEPVHNIHHKGLHYIVIDEDAKLPKGFRETVVKGKEKKLTAAEKKQAQEDKELAEMQAEEDALKAEEG